MCLPTSAGGFRVFVLFFPSLPKQPAGIRSNPSFHKIYTCIQWDAVDCLTLPCTGRTCAGLNLVVSRVAGAGSLDDDLDFVSHDSSRRRPALWVE